MDVGVDSTRRDRGTTICDAVNQISNVAAGNVSNGTMTPRRQEFSLDNAPY